MHFCGICSPIRCVNGITFYQSSLCPNIYIDNRPGNKTVCFTFVSTDFFLIRLVEFASIFLNVSLSLPLLLLLSFSSRWVLSASTVAEAVEWEWRWEIEYFKNVIRRRRGCAAYVFMCGPLYACLPEWMNVFRLSTVRGQWTRRGNGGGSLRLHRGRKSRCTN